MFERKERKMKYMVIVNQKYLVMVEAQSAGGAEHKILDDVYYGVETCQAFTMKEMGTEIFATLSANCETISFAEMNEKALAYKDHLEMIEEEKRKQEEYKKLIERYENELAVAKFNSAQGIQNLHDLERNIKTIW